MQCPICCPHFPRSDALGQLLHNSFCVEGYIGPGSDLTPILLPYNGEYILMIKPFPRFKLKSQIFKIFLFLCESMAICVKAYTYNMLKSFKLNINNNIMQFAAKF